MQNNQESIALHQYLNGIITNIPFGIVTVAKDLDVTMINSNALRLLGLRKHKPSQLVDEHYEHAFRNIPELLEGFQSEILEKNERVLNLERIEFEGRVLNIKCRAMTFGVLFIIEDFTQQAQLQYELQHQVDHDTLTNLVNRKELESRLDIFAKKYAENGLVGVIVFIDLDRFKPVNDMAGHAAGDALLQLIARIMEDTVRDRDTVARVGGDEFVILLENCPLSRAIVIVEKIRSTIDAFVFTWNDKSYSIGISAGISTITNELDNVYDAIDIADQACLMAKNEGRNCIHVAENVSKENTKNMEEISWIQTINEALRDDNFVLYAQEIRTIEENAKSSHYEILLRLRDKQGNILSPAAFMPSAERYELMRKIDEWVVKNSFKAYNATKTFSINLSGQTMSSPDFAEIIIALEEEYKIDPKNINFEITETMAITYYNNAQNMIETLRKRGYSFSLDDFGTGMSSYEYLKQMSIDYLKIDGIFIKEIVNDVVSLTMVKSINEIAHVMGIKTIAEYVENEAIYNKLKEIGIDYAQGYFVHKPEELI